MITTFMIIFVIKICYCMHSNDAFFCQVLVKTSVELAISLYAGVAILAAIASLCLPIETMGRAMK